MEPNKLLLAVFLWILAQPGIITLAVNKLKSIVWVSTHPKETAAILNFIASTVIGSLFYMYLPLEVNNAIVAFLTALATAITGSLLSPGYYEWIKPATTVPKP